jgi:hypothetical protein
MNSKLMFLLAVGGAALLFAADQPKKEPTEFDKLKAKVEMLEGRVQLLEAKLQAVSQIRRTAFETPKLKLTPESAPPNIGEIEVNGLKVYKVPLTATAK